MLGALAFNAAVPFKLFIVIIQMGKTLTSLHNILNNPSIELTIK